MARALVSPNEAVYRLSSTPQVKYKLDENTGQTKPYNFYPTQLVPNSARIVQLVTAQANQFLVASPLLWIEAPANVTPETHYFNTATQTIQAL